MANPEHVALVRQGANAIAAWREAYPGERLDLEKADLIGADLRGANLQRAKLHEAHLREADLSGAHLQNAGLRAAHLVGANLHGAHLQQAYLVRANLEHACLSWARLQRAHLHGAYMEAAHLQEANLQRAHLPWVYLVHAELGGAYLERADLQWANLHEANLAGAHLQEANLLEIVVGNTTFANTNLNGAQGLDTCRHLGSSPLDLGTLAKSGILPAAFLRGCGWSAALIGSVSELLHERPLRAAIERTIALPPEYQQVGLPLLAYFDTILRQQHPDIPAHLRIEPAGQLVRLLVDTPIGHCETVEQTLQAYGAVVAGHTTPEAWLVDPVRAQQLQQRLVVAETALRRTHDLLAQPEQPGALPLGPVTEAFRRLRRLLGNALHDL
jgi:uncharacterized protein YjbI with pentapeptide repeats